MTSLNEMIKLARTEYFPKLISSNKKNKKVPFDTINSIVSPVCLQKPTVMIFSISLPTR